MRPEYRAGAITLCAVRLRDLCRQNRMKLNAKMKRSLAAALLPVLVAAIAFTAQTYAYFTADGGTGESVIKAGNLEITLLEFMIPPGGTEPVPYRDPIRVMPATGVSKIVSVKNNGTLPAYVRLEVNKDITLSAAGQGETGDPSLIYFLPNTADWTESNGFYYYNRSLAPGEETTPLFTEVRFDPSMGNLYKDSLVTFRIYADAIQADYTGSSPMNAVGWPERNP
ncbi:MAG: hypothetical protein E7620_06740 [Ruminococcaceae bacterium]|nr:hypothetical protein [Oscillospiraceae bacterium]